LGQYQQVKSGRKRVMLSQLKLGTMAFLVAGILVPVTASADQFGNPTTIGQPGSVQVMIGGGQRSALDITSDATTVVTTIGGVSNSNLAPVSTTSYKENVATAGVSYAINPRAQIFANLASGTDTAQKSNSYALGFKFVPAQDTGPVKMGLMVRAQRVKIDVTGPFAISAPYNSVNNGTNTSAFMSLDGTDSLRYNRFDLFLGASATTEVLRPYGGFALTRISGTENVSLAGTPSVTTCPNAGGTCTVSTQAASINSSGNISGAKQFSLVAGLELNPDSALGMTLEARFGVEQMVSLTGHLSF
jgi:hypothetical protein